MNTVHNLTKKDSSYIVNITVPADIVKTSMNSVAAELQSAVQIPGFRNGAAPVDVVLQQFSSQIKEKVSARLVQQATYNAFADLGISAGARPSIAPESRPVGIRKWIGKFDMSGAFHFSVETPIPPEVNNVDIEGLHVVANPDEVERGVGEQLHHLRHDFAIKEKSSEPSSNLDEVVCSIDAFDADGNLQPDLSLKNFPLSFDLHKANFISAKLAQELLGRNASDEFQFTEDGMLYKIKVNDVLKKRLPDLNDAFAKELGFESVDLLKAAIRDEWIARNAIRVRGEQHAQIREQLVAKNRFDIPAYWLEEYSKNMAPEGIPEEERVKLSFVYAASDYLLELIGTKFPEETRLSDVDLFTYAREELGVSGVKPEDYMRFMMAKGQYDSWCLKHKRTKTLDWLVSRAKNSQ